MYPRNRSYPGVDKVDSCGANMIPLSDLFLLADISVY